MYFVVHLSLVRIGKVSHKKKKEEYKKIIIMHKEKEKVLGK